LRSLRNSEIDANARKEFFLVVGVKAASRNGRILTRANKLAGKKKTQGLGT